MTRRSKNGHQLKIEAHPYRVELPAVDGAGPRQALQEAAERLSGGRCYAWAPSRPWPPVLVFGFETESDRDAFKAWVAEHASGVA